jgi:hypothetical protein
MTANAEGQHPEEAGWRRFVPPWWTAIFPLLAAAGLAAWQTANSAEGGAGVFLASLIWPGGAAFLLVLVVVWLGWTLDLD